MDRRTFATGSSMVVSTALAGCIGSTDDETPESNEVSADDETPESGDTAEGTATDSDSNDDSDTNHDEPTIDWSGYGDEALEISGVSCNGREEPTEAEMHTANDATQLVFTGSVRVPDVGYEVIRY